MVDFWMVALIYTSLEISYWYYRWFAQLKKEPLPIVTSLLLAVFYAHAILAVNFGVRFFWQIDVLTKPIFPFMIWVGSVLHLIPIWKQKIHQHAHPGSYFIRAVIVSVIFSYFFKGFCNECFQ